ncbi:MAG: maleylpyruvate isomerase N-terminal domain-containing protein [Actinomycetota bacterium]
MKDAFLDAADTARELLDAPRLDELWESESALDRMTVGELCAHLSRAVTVVPGYLMERGTPPLVDAPGYFLALMPDGGADLDSRLAVSVRERAKSEAAVGLEAVASAWDDARARLGIELGEDLSRPIAVRGSSMRTDDYLVTRLVELVVHADDMASSLGVETPRFGAGVTDAVLACLLEIAKRRSGAMAVVRAMTRRERSDPGTLLVF